MQKKRTSRETIPKVRSHTIKATPFLVPLSVYPIFWTVSTSISRWEYLMGLGCAHGKTEAASPSSDPKSGASMRVPTASVESIMNHLLYVNRCFVRVLDMTTATFIRNTEDPSDSTKSGVAVQDGVTRGSEESSNTSIFNSEAEVKRCRWMFLMIKQNLQIAASIVIMQ